MEIVFGDVILIFDEDSFFKSKYLLFIVYLDDVVRLISVILFVKKSDKEYKLVVVFVKYFLFFFEKVS